MAFFTGKQNIVRIGGGGCGKITLATSFIIHVILF